MEREQQRPRSQASMCARCTDRARLIWSQAGLQVFSIGRGANRGAARLSVSGVHCFPVTGENPSTIKAISTNSLGNCVAGNNLAPCGRAA